jgi:hypothetical protein
MRRSDGSVVAWGDNTCGQCNAPALPPGMTFSRVAAGGWYTAAIIQSGACTTFGPGCPGSAGLTHLEAAPLRLGTTAQIQLQPLPQNTAMLVFGLSNLNSALGPLPVDLAAYGMPGCFGRVSMDTAVFVQGVGGSANHALVVPNVPTLAGFVVHSQALVFDAAAGNVAGLVTSDAVTLVVGP